MSTFMPIITALKSGLIKPEDFVEYIPDKKRYMNTEGMFFSTELKETEFDLGWHVIAYKGFGVLLVADKATKATIMVSYEYGISEKMLEEYSDLYQNKSLQSKGTALTTDLLEEIPKEHRQNNVWCVSHKLKSFLRRTAWRKPRNPAIPHDHRRNIGPSYCSKHMQPVLFLPPDTIVEIENKGKARNFKLYPRNSKDTSKVPKQCLDFVSKPIWVPITEAVRTRTVFSTSFVKYVPDKASISFSTKETGSEQTQTAETEYDMGGWRLIVLRKDCTYLPYLVATHCTKFELYIPTMQENQFSIGIQVLEKYAKLYNSKELGTQAIPFNEELFNALNGDLIFEGDMYFLADTFRNRFYFAAGFPLSVYGLSKTNYELRTGLKYIVDSTYGYIQDEEPVSKLPIRIAIPLPENIMVQINNSEYDGSSEEKAMKIKMVEENSQ